MNKHEKNRPKDTSASADLMCQILNLEMLWYVQFKCSLLHDLIIYQYLLIYFLKIIWIFFLSCLIGKNLPSSHAATYLLVGRSCFSLVHAVPSQDLIQTHCKQLR